MGASERPWVVVLAAGRGRRPAAAIVTADGEPVPPRFRAVDGRPSPAAQAVARAGRLTTPDHVLAVVDRQDGRWWRDELAAVPPENLIIQPRDRGTATAVLLPFLHVLRRAPNAPVLVVSADEPIDDEAAFQAAAERALAAAGAPDNRVVLLARRAAAAGPDTVRLAADGSGDGARVVSVEAIHEAGPWAGGTSLAARPSGVLRLYERAAPWLLRVFLPSLAQRWWWRPWTLAELFDLVPAQDFARDILRRAPGLLRMVAVDDPDWDDLALPGRRAFGGHPYLPY
jgi:hypothetical protein